MDETTVQAWLKTLPEKDRNSVDFIRGLLMGLEIAKKVYNGEFDGKPVGEMDCVG